MSVYKEKDSYLREAIESILNQTYKSFEFVIVGDTPPSDRERVFGIIEEYASRDERIKFIPNENNMGITKSLNVGLGYCTGKYIARMDADDISFPTRLEKQVAFMESNPHLLASSARCEYITEDGERTGRILHFIQSSKKLRLIILKEPVLRHPLAIYKRIINGIEVRYDESFKYAQDYALWVWIMQHGEISNIEEVLLYNRISKDQISTAHLPEQQLCAKGVQRNALELLYDFPFSEAFMDSFFNITINVLIPKKEISASRTMTDFQDYFSNLKVNRKNYYAIKYMINLYIKFFSYKTSNKRIYRYIYELTKKNKTLLVLCEMNFIFKWLICISNSLSRAFYNSLSEYSLSVKEMFNLPKFVPSINRSAIS